MESLNKNWFAITLTAVVFGILGFLLGRQGKQQHMMFMKGGPDKMLGGKNMIMIKKEDGKEIEWIEDIENIDIQKEVGQNILDLRLLVKKNEIRCYLSTEADVDDCYIEIHARAGGTESQDWADMLRRIDLKWAEIKKFKSNQLTLKKHKWELNMRVALITGGTRGIGAAISIKLKETGYKVAAVYAGNDEVATKFSEENKVDIFKWSISNYEECVDGIKRVEEKLGPIDILVNNAGITRDGMFHKMSKEQWRDVIDVNLNGLFNMTHPIWDGMRTRGFGRIVNISSINGQKGQLGQANYSAAKAGELGFTKSLALEGARKGITVNAICPGYIKTDMVKAMSEKAIEATESQIPIGHLGQPDDIARCVQFLVADEASFITGSTITANGGHYLI